MDSIHTQDQTDTQIDLGIEELDEMIDPGFWGTAAGVVGGTIVGGAVVYGGAVLIAT